MRWARENPEAYEEIERGERDWEDVMPLAAAMAFEREGAERHEARMRADEEDRRA